MFGKFLTDFVLLFYSILNTIPSDTNCMPLELQVTLQWEFNYYGYSSGKMIGSYAAATQNTEECRFKEAKVVLIAIYRQPTNQLTMTTNQRNAIARLRNANAAIKQRLSDDRKGGSYNFCG